MSQLLPDGIDHLGEAPYTLHQAITAALRILQYEEFPLEERPPRRIWLDGECLREHWARVEKERQEKYNPSKRTIDTDEDEGPGEENAVELISGR